MRVRGSCEPARGPTTTGQAAPNGPNGGEYENTYLVEAEGGSFSRRHGQVYYQPNRRAGGRRGASLMSTAAYSDEGDFKPAWKTSPGVGLYCYLEKDARTPQDLALNWWSPKVAPRVRQRRETDY